MRPAYIRGPPLTPVALAAHKRILSSVRACDHSEAEREKVSLRAYEEWLQVDKAGNAKRRNSKHEELHGMVDAMNAKQKPALHGNKHAANAANRRTFLQPRARVAK